MDKSVLTGHYDILSKHYNLDVTQLGLTVLWLGMIRSSMGHENVEGTVDNYIHPKGLQEDVRKCVDFLEREVLGIKKSKLDVDYWKRGNKGEFRRDHDKTQLVG